MTPILAFILFAAVIGLICWGIGFIPKPAPFQQLIVAAGIIVVIIAFLQFLGVNLGVPHVNFIK